MNTLPLVSICIPVYNGAPYLRETLESAAAQTYSNIEIVVNNDGSTDSSQEIIDDFFRKCPIPHTLTRSEKPTGLTNGFRCVCAAAKGDYVKLQCQDDLIHPECVAEQVRAIEFESNISLVACRRRVIDVDGRVLMIPPGPFKKSGRYDGRQLVARCMRYGRNMIGEPMAVLFRKRDLDRCGSFAKGVMYYVDAELWMRLLQLGDFYYIEKPLADFRLHGSSATAGIRKKVVREFIDWERNMEALGIIKKNWCGRLFRYSSVYILGVLRGLAVRVARWRQRKSLKSRVS